MLTIKKDIQDNIGVDEKFYYPLLPLRDVVVFPNVVVPLFVGRKKSIKALEYALSHEKEVFLSAQSDAGVDDPTPKDIYSFGTLGAVLQLLKLPDGTVKALIEGKERGQIENFMDKQGFFMVEVSKCEELTASDLETEALMRSINTSFEEYAKLNAKIGKEIVSAVTAIEDPGRLADTIAGHLAMKVTDKQGILETTSRRNWRIWKRKSSVKKSPGRPISG